MHQSYCIRVTMDELMYPVWRSLLIPGHIQLKELHQVIQAAFGWMDLHDYCFWTEVDGCKTEMTPEVLVSSYLGQEAKLFYLYDFSDRWLHTIEVEEIIQSDRPLKHIKCIAGNRHRPPESVGGVLGYQEFLDIVTNPKNPRYYEQLEWAEKDTSGRKFDPDYFYILEINRRLALC